MFEEWWGRTVEGRGSIDYNNMPDTRPETIRKLQTYDLLRHIASEPNSTGGLVAQMELRRRENWTARAAIVISIVALVVAAAT